MREAGGKIASAAPAGVSHAADRMQAVSHLKARLRFMVSDMRPR
jgi:hypothetical protein